jgi:predicted transport protein
VSITLELPLNYSQIAHGISRSCAREAVIFCLSALWIALSESVIMTFSSYQTDRAGHMSDIQLFRLSNETAIELPSQVAKLEKHLQSLIEANMQTLLGVRFLASEYITGKTHRGRIDSLGLDENGCPVIVEYKRHSNENVINQGLYYLDWLLDHQAEFRWLVMDKLGKVEADKIEWAGTRLLCIAADFTRYDQHAVQQIPRNVELIRYKLFGDDLLLLELVNAQSISGNVGAGSISGGITASASPLSDVEVETVVGVNKTAGKDKTVDEQLALASQEIRDLYANIASYLLSLGDDVQEKQLKLYTAFRRLKNFACAIPYPNKILMILRLAPSTVPLEEGFSRDISQIGHWGTGDVEVTLRNQADFDRAKALLERSYTEA